VGTYCRAEPQLAERQSVVRCMSQFAGGFPTISRRLRPRIAPKFSSHVKVCYLSELVGIEDRPVGLT
jgi:hypothetical protein